MELLRNAVYTQYMDHMITNSIPDMAYNGYFATTLFWAKYGVDLTIIDVQIHINEKVF